MDFHGFSSVKQYEAECASHGYQTRRVKLSGPVPGAFALITSPPTSTGVETWEPIGPDQVPFDFSEKYLYAILDVQKDFYGKLSALGYSPAEDPGFCPPASEPIPPFSLVIPDDDMEQIRFF